MQRRPAVKAIVRATLYGGCGLLFCWLADRGIRSGSLPGPRYEPDITLAAQPVWFWLYEILFCGLAGLCLYTFFRHVRWLFSRGEAASRQSLDALDILEIEQSWAYPYFAPVPPVQTGAIGSYVAGNPWGRGRTDRFTVEVYQRVVQWGAADKRRINQVQPAQLLPTDLLAIRFEHGGRSHRLPDSLATLWRSGQVPTEALPQLLHELQPRLRHGGYMPMLLVQGYEWTGIVLAVLLFGAAAACLVLIPPDSMGTGSLRADQVLAIGIFLIGLGCLIGCDGYAHWLLRRRRRQARWIIAAKVPNAATLHAPDTLAT